MSTLRINNIEAKSVPASPTLDEKVKITNSTGDILIHVDGKTSGITTIGINTTASNITFDANSNIVVTGVITASHFYGNGSGLTNLATNLVNDTTPQLGGNLDTNSHEISLDTSHAINFGDSNELRVFYHSGNGQIDFNGNTSLQLKTPANKYFQVVNRDNGNNIIQCQAGGTAQLYFNGTKKLETASGGVTVTGTVAATSYTGDGSNLTGVSEFDDNNIINDISALALKVSALENSAASNTNSTYVDSFQDSNGIASFTNTTRNTSGDFISSVSPKSFYKPNQAYFTYTLSSNGTAQNGACTFAAWMRSANGSNWTYNGSQGGGIMAFESAVSSSKYLTYNIGYGSNNGKFGAHTPGLSDCNTTNAWSAPTNKWVLGIVRTGYNWSTAHVEIMHRAYDAGSFTTDADSNGGTDNYGVKASGIGRLFRHASNSYTGDYDNTYIAHMGFWNVSLNNNQINALFNNGEPFDWTQNNGNYNVASNLQEYFKMDEGSGTTLTNSANGGNATLQSGSGSWDTDTQQIGSANATGNFISNTITASSSTNKMGVVITYTDTTGTATLNTDLKVSLSANNGSNYTQVTLVAQPNFATGVKMALANDVTVTAGTQLKYKVEFANQASGSKVTRVTGISLQY